MLIGIYLKIDQFILVHRFFKLNKNVYIERTKIHKEVWL